MNVLGHTLITAFNTTKTVHQWAMDNRCKVQYRTFVERLQAGVPAEQAMQSAKGRYRKAGAKFSRLDNITAFKETKPLWQWAKDPRCKVSELTLKNRIAAGISPEDAITSSRHSMQVRREKSVTSRHDKHKAYNEIKTLADWAKDNRCLVSETTLKRRIDLGVPIEEALVRPLYAHKRKQHGQNSYATH